MSDNEVKEIWNYRWGELNWITPPEYNKWTSTMSESDFLGRSWSDYISTNNDSGLSEDDFNAVKKELLNNINRLRNKKKNSNIKCDCGAEKVKTTHSHWCAVSKIDD